MKKQQILITAKDLAEEITMLIKEELVAAYTIEETALQVHFLNGQSFRLTIEEIE